LPSWHEKKEWPNTCTHTHEETHAQNNKHKHWQQQKNKKRKTKKGLTGEKKGKKYKETMGGWRD